jgi:hypothetical protein
MSDECRSGFPLGALAFNAIGEITGRLAAIIVTGRRPSGFVRLGGRWEDASTPAAGWIEGRVPSTASADAKLWQDEQRDDCHDCVDHDIR